MGAALLKQSSVVPDWQSWAESFLSTEERLATIDILQQA